MNELIKVTTNENNKQVVSARGLYNELAIKKRFSEWWNTNSKGFVDGIDYTPYLEVHPQNKQEIQNYAMILDMAKHLAIQTQSEKGFEVRTYFIEIEKQYKQQPISNPNLSPELQIMQGLLNQMATQEQAIASNQRDNQRIEHKVDNISEIVAIDSRDWRNKTNSILRKIAIKQGGFDMYQEIGNESYMLLEKRGRCNLDIRLENRRKNMITQGVGKTKVKKLNKLDIIAEDSRLTEIYLSVVKDMAIKYGVHLEEEIAQEV